MLRVMGEGDGSCGFRHINRIGLSAPEFWLRTQGRSECATARVCCHQRGYQTHRLRISSLTREFEKLP